MRKTVTSRYDVSEHLRTPEEMAAYLEACLEDADGDAAFIAKDIRLPQLTIEATAGRVPVIAAGATSLSPEEQIEGLNISIFSRVRDNMELTAQEKMVIEQFHALSGSYSRCYAIPDPAEAQ